MYNESMKEKFNVEEDMDLVEVELMDDSEWEYLRMGIGECEDGVFVVDLEEGDDEREMKYVKEELSVEDVCKIGIEVGVLVDSSEWGYDENDVVRVNWELEGDEEKWKEFWERVM